MLRKCRASFGFDDDDSKRAVPVIVLDQKPESAKPARKYTRCICCESDWYIYSGTSDCDICHRPVCSARACSKVNIAVMGRWVRACTPCWKITSAEISQYDEQMAIGKKFEYDLREVEYDGYYGSATAVVPAYSQTAKGLVSRSKLRQATNWEAAEKMWATSVDTLYADIQGFKQTGQELQVAREQLLEEIATLQAKNALLEKKAAAATELTAQVCILNVINQNKQYNLGVLEEKLTVNATKLKDAEKRADELMARAGKAHIKRDWRRMDAGTGFPAGDDLRDAFEAPFLQFESFACDVVTSLENLGHKNATDILVPQVLRPLYEATEKYVTTIVREKEAVMQREFNDTVPDDITNDTVTKLFWFTRMQEVVPGMIGRVTDAAVAELMQQMGALVPSVHAQMLVDGENNIISNTENDIRFPALVRAMLRLFAYAKLSDPYCYLLPVPGTMVSYHPDRCVEVLSPGARKHGQIKEGDRVEVVHCGLYFEDPSSAFDNTRPVVKCRVRRIVTKKK
jgi:hypothetical protein